MSDSRQVLVNAADLELLIQAASQLSAAAISLATSASSQPRSDCGSFVQIASESEPEGLDNRQFVWDSELNRIAEDGPGPIPDQLLEFGRVSLPVSEYSAHIRVAVASGPVSQLIAVFPTLDLIHLLEFRLIGLCFVSVVVNLLLDLRTSPPLRSLSVGPVRVFWFTRCFKTLLKCTSFVTLLVSTCHDAWCGEADAEICK